MIVRDRPSLLVLFFILRGSVLPMIFPQVLFVLILSAFVVWGHNFWPVLVPGFNSAPLALVGIALAAWAFFGSLAEFAERIRLFRVPLKDSWTRAAHLPRSAWGMTIAHACLGISILGMTGTSAWQTEVIQAMKPGETAQLAQYSVRFDSVSEVQGANFRAEEGVFTVTKGGALVATLKPQRRSYPITRMTTTESAIHTTVFSDVYIALGDPTQNGTAWIVRLYHHPLVPWIWLGALGMMAGGLVSLSDRRFRVGAPERRRSAAKPTMQPAE